MKSVLIVEDEKALSEAYGVVLTSLPYSFDIANDGAAAIKLCEKTNYDLILLDLIMPVLDGIGFLNTLTTIKRDTFSPRIIAFSNLSSGKLVDEALRLGAHKYVLKSDLSPSQLIELINEELS